MGRLTTHGIPLGSHLNALSIAEELSISRTTVNKAIARLVEEGWVHPNTHRRPVVAAYPPKETAAPAEPGFTFANQTEQTYEALLERVLRGEAPPGELLKERRLAKQLGVNPVTIHRACEWLCNDGLLVRLRRRGWQVVSFSADDLREIYRIRVMLEPLGVPDAARRISFETLDALERDIDHLIAQGGSSSAYERRQADYRLHRAIYEASGNRILGETLDPLIRKALIVTTVAFRDTRITRVLREHKQIIAALRQRNATRAARLLEDHLRSAMEFNVSTFGQVP